MSDGSHRFSVSARSPLSPNATAGYGGIVKTWPAPSYPKLAIPEAGPENEPLILPLVRLPAARAEAGSHGKGGS